MHMADRHGQAHSLGNLGIVYERQGRHEEALTHLQESLAIFQELGDSSSEARSLYELGVTLRALGRIREARAHWQEALAIHERLQATDAATQVRTLLAELPPVTSPQVQALQHQGSR
jgi:tetratricopeptide (TPR) repeat protein